MSKNTLYIVGGIALLGAVIYLFMKKTTVAGALPAGVAVGQPCKMANGNQGIAAANGQCSPLTDAQAITSGLTSLLNPLAQVAPIAVAAAK